MNQLPRWAEIGLIPLINLSLALLVAGLVIALIGEDPLKALDVFGMERSGSGACINLGFQPLNPQFRQINPFPPADDHRLPKGGLGVSRKVFTRHWTAIGEG